MKNPVLLRLRAADRFSAITRLIRCTTNRPAGRTLTQHRRVAGGWGWLGGLVLLLSGHLTGFAQVPALLWQKTLGGNGTDEANAVSPTADGGFVVVGTTNSSDGDVTGQHDGNDYWVVRLDATGTKLWQKTLGGSDNDLANAVTATADGGVVVAGTTSSNNRDVTGQHGGDGYWVVRLETPAPTITGLGVSPSIVSTGQTIRFSTTVGNVSGLYSYTLTNGASSLVSGTLNTSAFSQAFAATGSGPQTYTLTVSAANGTATGTVPLTVNPQPGGLAITSVSPVSCTLVDAPRGEYRVGFTPLYTGQNSQPISFSVVNELLPTTQPAPYTLRLYSDNPAITLVANQEGNPETRYRFAWLAACPSGTDPNPPPAPPTGFTITGVHLVSCEPDGPNRYRVSLNPEYGGLSGQPISFSVVNEKLPTTDPGPYSLNLYVDNPAVTLSAQQGSTLASFRYFWLAACLAGARLGAEPGGGLSVRVLGNPVIGDAVAVEVRGAEGQPLELRLTFRPGPVGESSLD